MTTNKGGYEASLSRYNARKRELQASMLEYSDHMRHLHAHGASSSRLTCKDPYGARLELRDRSHFFTRHSDQAFLTKRLRHDQRPARRNRPSSLDEKELQLNAKIREAPKRDTKSERPPVNIPTASLPPVGDQSISPDSSRKGNARVSFVSASDLCDLVDIGASSKSPRKESTKIVNVREGIKLIEDIDFQSRRDRNIAWEKQSIATVNSSRDNSPSRINYTELITGTKICPQVASSKSLHNNVAATAKAKGGGGSEDKMKGKIIMRSESEEILPLNSLLEQAAASYLKYQNKIRTRPKRAKRMQLHKPDLVVIPEDGGTFVYPGGEKVSSNDSRVRDTGAKLPPLSSTSTVSKMSSITHNNDIITNSNSQSPVINNTNNNNNNINVRSNTQSLNHQYRPTNASINDERNRKTILKRSGKLSSELSGEGRRLDDLIVTNSVYPPLPWEKETRIDHEDRTKRVTFDPSSSVSKIRAQRHKLKRLVFLRDQPDQSYRQEV